MSAPAPWLPRERTTVALAGVGCVVLLFVCWFIAAGKGHTDDQLLWLDLGTAGVLVYWIVAGRVVGRARRRVAERRRAQLAAWLPAGTGDVAPVRATTLLTAPGMSRAHRPTCPLLAGKATEPAPADAPMCGICG